jgi:hypothetical protein
MNGTRWAIRPATKATSRDNRSSLDTTMLHLALRGMETQKYRPDASQAPRSEPQHSEHEEQRDCHRG